MTTKMMLTLLLVFLAPETHAQRAPKKVSSKRSVSSSSAPSAKKGKVRVTFDDELVKGTTMLPEGDAISSRLENRFKRFIKVRQDFIQDVENTKDEFGHK